jgi:hypothetical protein
MENMAMTDQLSGSTLIEPKKNVEKDKMEFSSSIQDVMSAPIDVPPMPTTSEAVYASEPKRTSSASTGYPLNMTKEQVESLLAGVAAVIGVSGPVQDKLGDMIPSFFNEMGKLSPTGMAVTVLVVAIVFYFLKQIVTKSR